MVSTLTKQAFAINVEGLYLFIDKKYSAAIIKFSEGLTVIKKIMAVEDEVDDHQYGSSVNPFCDFFKIQTSQAHSLEAYDESMFPTKGEFIFREPLHIPEPFFDAASDKCHVYLSFVLLYNLALSHHLQALDGNTITSKKLKKALSLYELAYTIQMTEEIQLTVLQTMAIVNNLGQIHTAVNNSEKSQQCFQHLLSTIMYLKDCDERGSVEHMEGFMSNVMPLILRTSQIAPAA